jgi:hypothetical protein
VSYATPVALRAEVLDLSRREERAGAAGGSGDYEYLVVDVDNEELSLWDRSAILERPLDYVQTIVMPPMFVVPDDAARAGASLTEKLTADLVPALCRGLRTELMEKERTVPLRILLHAPPVGGEVRGGSLFLRFDVLSRGAVPLTALDIHRLASGVEKYRWLPDADDLGLWNAALGARGQARIEVPDPIPFAAGVNLIKVRALREDGEQVSRTIVYHMD